MASEFSFQELITRRAADAGIAIHPKQTRLVRHDTRGRKIWNLGRAEFEHWVSFQRSDRHNPYNGCSLAFQFIPAQLPGARAGALFVGAHHVHDQWLWGGVADGRQPAMFDVQFPEHIPYAGDNANASDLVRVDAFDEFSERVLIEWSPTAHGTRSWSQWWKNTKPIVEIRTAPMAAPFPGFDSFQSRVDEIELVPTAWREVLSSVSGIYLLVCQETGQQYVGSAHGEQGLYGRWLEYAHTGHGGNKMLKAMAHHNFRVSILEIAANTTSTSELIHREQVWKDKLGSRVFGLNAN